MYVGKSKSIIRKLLSRFLKLFSCKKFQFKIQNLIKKHPQECENVNIQKIVWHVKNFFHANAHIKVILNDSDNDDENDINFNAFMTWFRATITEKQKKENFYIHLKTTDCTKCKI